VKLRLAKDLRRSLAQWGNSCLSEPGLRRTQLPWSQVKKGARLASKRGESSPKTADDSEFEPVIPRASLHASARDELRLLYDGLDGEVISLDDI